MTRVLVVWEDLYFEPLGLFVRRRLAQRAPLPATVFPELLFHTSRGNGGFSRYVHSTWPRARANGLPTNAGPIDHLVCVVDGDRISELVPHIESRPGSPAGVPAWHASAEAAWEKSLAGACDASTPPSTVRGRLLRWSKESLVLAGYDQEAARIHLRIDIGAARAAAHLRSCSPAPPEVQDSVFSDVFRRPLGCIQALQKALGVPVVDKKDADLDDALRALAKHHLSRVCDRVPDIDRLVDLIWTLTRGAPTGGPGVPATEA